MIGSNETMIEYLNRFYNARNTLEILSIKMEYGEHLRRIIQTIRHYYESESCTLFQNPSIARSEAEKEVIMRFEDLLQEVKIEFGARALFATSHAGSKNGGGRGGNAGRGKKGVPRPDQIRGRTWGSTGNGRRDHGGSRGGRGGNSGGR